MNYIGVGVEAVVSEIGILQNAQGIVDEPTLIRGLQFRFEVSIPEIKKAILRAEEGHAIQRNGTEIKLYGPVA